jgi:hypothetical protein
MLKRSILALVFGALIAVQFGCAPVAAGVAGAAIGAGAAKHRDRHDHDRD